MEFTNEDAEYARKVLDGGIGSRDDKHRVRFTAAGEDATRHVSLPAQIMRQMISAIRGEHEDKPFPHTFMGGRVVAAARFQGSKGTVRHQGVIIREYEDNGRTEWSVHYLVAERATDPWSGDIGAYGIPTLKEAFTEFTERMHRRGKLPR